MSGDVKQLKSLLSSMMCSKTTLTLSKFCPTNVYEHRISFGYVDGYCGLKNRPRFDRGDRFRRGGRVTGVTPNPLIGEVTDDDEVIEEGNPLDDKEDIDEVTDESDKPFVVAVAVC